MKCKKDDKIKIVGNSNWHSYNIWEEFYIIKVLDYEHLYRYQTSKTKWGEPTVDWYVRDEDCILVEEAITPWIMVGASNFKQKHSDKNYKENIKVFYVWKNKKWKYVVEENNWDLYACEFISIKKKGEIPKYTMKQLKDKIWNFELVK